MATLDLKRIGELIAQEHEAVKEAMHQIDALVRRTLHHDKPHAERVRDLGTHLRDFGGHLQRHFELEETGGFLEGVDQTQPSAHEKVEQLRREHREIVDKVYWLVQELEHFLTTGDVKSATIKHHVARLFTMIREHEAVEDDMIQESLYVELGDAD